MTSNGQPFVLIAEDMESDVELLRRSFEIGSVCSTRHVVGDGEECVAYLSGTGIYSNRDEYPLPDLLLLDLKMPRMNGFDVLKWIRSQPYLSPMRVVVLTNSERTRDINRAYELGANAFLTKPVNSTDFADAIRAMFEFWMKHSRKPEIKRPPLRYVRT